MKNKKEIKDNNKDTIHVKLKTQRNLIIQIMNNFTMKQVKTHKLSKHTENYNNTKAKS